MEMVAIRWLSAPYPDYLAFNSASRLNSLDTAKSVSDDRFSCCSIWCHLRFTSNRTTLQTSKSGLQASCSSAHRLYRTHACAPSGDRAAIGRHEQPAVRVRYVSAAECKLIGLMHPNLAQRDKVVWQGSPPSTESAPSYRYPMDWKGV